MVRYNTIVIHPTDPTINPQSYKHTMMQADASAPPPAPTTASNPGIDTTLLRGLEPVMTAEEQRAVTAMLTSGNPNELARAAQVLHEVSTNLMDTKVHQRSEQQSVRLKKLFVLDYRPKARPGFNNREERVAQEKKENDLELHRRATALPLPVRMPRYEVIQAFDPDSMNPDKNGATDSSEEAPRRLFGILPGRNLGILPGRKNRPSLSFVDDTSNGTLAEAFTKITVQDSRKEKLKLPPADGAMKDSMGTTVLVQKSFQATPGFDEIVQAVGYEYSVCPANEPRVLISRTLHDAAKVALKRGDSVTHINGHEFFGTVQDLRMLLTALQADSEVSQLEIVVNAEPCVAKALQLRSWAQ